MTSPAERAEVLRVVLTLAGGVPVLEAEEAAKLAGPRIVPGDLRTMTAHSEDDLALVNACLVVEHELRELAFAAAERLLTLAAVVVEERETVLAKRP